MNSLEIHMLPEQDVNATAEIYLAHLRYAISSVRDAYRKPNAALDAARTRKRYRDYLSRLVTAHNADHPLLVAVLDGQVVGFAEGRLKQGTVPLQLPCQVTSGYLQLVHTLEFYRGRGIARNLEAHLLDYFSRHGARYAELDYFVGNDLAVKTWPALGYRVFYEDVRKCISTQPAELEERQNMPGSPLKDLEIREMDAPEIPQVIDLYTDMIAYYASLDDPFLQRPFERTVQLEIEVNHLLEKQLKDSNFKILVASKSGMVVGFMAAGVKECPVPAFMAAVRRIGSIGAAYVKSGFRGKRIASMLERQIESHFREAGISLIEHLRVFNASTLERKFWRSAGYKVFNFGARKILMVS